MQPPAADPRLRISASAFLWLALLLLVLPLPWIVAAMFAATVHELCHLLTIHMCGGNFRAVHIGSSGALIRTAHLTLRQELFCTLAGPLGGILLLLFARWLPRVAVCAAFQSAFNLLPIYPLDGGRSLRCVLSRFSPAVAERVCSRVSQFCCVLLIVIGIWAAVSNLGATPLFLAMIVCLKAHRRKIPCKENVSAVQ